MKDVDWINWHETQVVQVRKKPIFQIFADWKDVLWQNQKRMNMIRLFLWIQVPR